MAVVSGAAARQLIDGLTSPATTPFTKAAAAPTPAGPSGHPPKSAPWPRAGVWKAQAGDWFVPSESTAGVFWHVRWLHPASGPSFYTCTCPHGRHRREMTMDALRDGRRLAAPCRHVRAALDADRANGQPPLSTAPPNIAALCD